MSPQGFRVAALATMREAPKHGLELDAAWKPLRHYLGVSAFGVNAYVAEREGSVVIEEHDEADIGHEEMYVVVAGRAEFELGGEVVDAPPGTVVFLADPALSRKAIARAPDTTILAVGAKPGEAFTPSSWETRRTAGLETAS